MDLVKRMSVQNLYNQTNVQLEKGVVASEHHGDNETEGIKPMEFHIKADDEDAAESNQVGIAVSRPSSTRQLTEKGRKYQAEWVLEKRTKAMIRLQRKARAIDDLLYSGTNHVTVKEALGQYSDIFKLLSTYHEKYCELVDADDQKDQAYWFDDLDQDVFNFKHKIHNWLKESDIKSSRPSSRGSSRSKKSSGSTTSSSSSKSSTQLKLLEKKAKTTELEAEATFIMEKQKAEQQAKMLYAKIYEDYIHIKSRASTRDEEEPDEVIEEKYINRRQRLMTATEELDSRSCDQLATCDKTSEQKMKTVQRKPKVRIEDAEPTADRRGPKQTALNSEGNQKDMVGMMSKLIRQQTAPDVDINIFSGHPVDYHYFIAVFEEVVEKKIDGPRGRLARLIRYTDGEPKEMIKYCIQQPVSVGYKNPRSLLEEKYGNSHYTAAAYRKETKSWP